MSDQNGEGTASAAPDPFAEFSAKYDELVSDETLIDGHPVPDGDGEPSEEPASGPERGEDGKFKAKDPESAEGDDPEPDASEPEPEGEAGDAEDAAPTIEPAPAHLPEGIKQAWANMPEEGRQAIAAYSKDVDRKFGEIGRQMRESRAIVDPVMQMAQEAGYNSLSAEQLGQGVAEIMQVQLAMHRDPVQTWLSVADRYGIKDKIQQAWSGEQPSEGQQVVADLRQQVSNLQRQLADVSNPDRVRQLFDSEFTQRQTLSTVNDFASQREHWQAVEADMPAFIQVVQNREPNLAPAQVLERAYDMAVNAIPELREKAKPAAPQAAAAPDPARAEKARRAASANISGKSAGKPRPKTEYEVFSELYDKAVAS